MSEAEIVGLIAGAVIALAFIPQVTRVWMLRSAREISLPFNILFIAGTTFWLLYGLLLGLASVIFWNCVNGVLLLTLLAAKLKYGMGEIHTSRRQPRQPHSPELE